MIDGWEWCGAYACSCGAWCVDWRNRETHRWRIQHGEGEALFEISLDRVVDELALPTEETSYQRWLTRVHEYERRAA